MKKKLIFCLAFLITAIVCRAQSADSANNTEIPTGLAVFPAIVYFHLNAGQAKVEKVTVVNNLQTTKSFRVYLDDFKRDSTGKHLIDTPGSFANISCAKWLTVEPKTLTLQKGQQAQISLTLHLPDSAGVDSAMKWCLLVVESVEEQLLSKKTTAGVHQEVRMGVHVYQTPPDVNEKGVKMLSFTKVPDQKGLYKITCKNTGKVQLDNVKVFMELTKFGSKKRIKVGPKTFPLFPDQYRIAKLTLPDTLSRGKYSVIGAVDGGSDVPLEAMQAIIEIK
jgi:hypothetical protein